MSAIEINGVAIEKNKKAFQLGRSAAHDIDKLQRDLFSNNGGKPTEKSFAEKLQYRLDYLTNYQNATYADKLKQLVTKTQNIEISKLGRQTELSQAVMQGYFKLLAYKDEYEVARLLVDRKFQDQLEKQYPKGFEIKYHLAPPTLSLFKRSNEESAKREFGGWLTTPLKALARLKILRGTAFDIFGYHQERRIERQLIEEYENSIEGLLEKLNDKTLPTIVEIAKIPLAIRGYGRVKTQSLESAKETQQRLLDSLH